MPNNQNLWPSSILGQSEIPLPVSILQDQAKWLGTMTQNILVGIVTTYRSEGSIKLPSGVIPGLTYTLRISAPTFGNYDFELVKLIQENITPYPLLLQSSFLEISYNIPDHNALLSCLQSIFNNPKVISTIQILIAQSKQVKP